MELAAKILHVMMAPCGHAPTRGDVGWRWEQEYGLDAKVR